MKTTIFSTISLLIILACASCGSQAPTGKTFATDSVTATANSEGVEVSISAVYPHFTGEQPSVLGNAVCEFIDEQLGGTYQGSLRGDSLLQYYANLKGAALRKDYAELKALGSSVPALHYGVEIEKIYETSQYVTYLFTQEDYLGGAHGSMQVLGMTFRKSDGRRFGWDMLHDEEGDAFRKIMKEGLMRYFSEQGFRINNDEDLQGALLIDDMNSLPHPVSPPYLTSEGIRFIYQQYEVACYAAGMPTFAVPLHKVDPFLSSAAKAMVKAAAQQSDVEE